MRGQYLYSLWVALSGAPGVDDLDSATFEVRDIAGRDCSPVAEGDGGNLRIKMRDRAPGSPAFGGNAGVWLCGIAAKGKNATGKVFPEHRFGRDLEGFPPPARPG